MSFPIVLPQNIIRDDLTPEFAGKPRTRCDARVLPVATYLLRLEAEGQCLVWATVRIGLICLLFFAKNTYAQIQDPFDGGAPAWVLGRNDCGARLLSQQRVASGGRSGGPCESIALQTGLGTLAELVYPIDKTEVIDELSVGIWYWSAKPGAILSLRVRYPNTIDPVTGQAATTWLGSAVYTQPGQWQQLRLVGATRDMVMRQAVLRKTLGRDIDLRQPFVDALIINAYTGPGYESIRIDDLQIQNALPARVASGKARVATPSDAPIEMPTAFPVRSIGRYLEYNGESLSWLKANGFTGILLKQVPAESLLREAAETRIRVIAPLATVDRRDLQNLLMPVVAWNLGDALLENDISRVSQIAQRMRRLGPSFRRELIGLPIESHRRYRSITDYTGLDFPPPERGLTSAEEAAWMAEQVGQIGHAPRIVAALASGPCKSLRDQLDAMAVCVGSPPIEDYGWHATWTQAMRALELNPRGILYRSSGPLDSGSPEDQQRATVLRLINQFIELAEPLISGGSAAVEIACQQPDYRAHYLRNANAGLVIASATSAGGSQPRAGDGRVLQLAVPPAIRGQTIFRLTGMRLERLPIESSDVGPVVSIVSPDFVEVLLVASDPRIHRSVDARLQRIASKIGFDRWQLVYQSLLRTTHDWTGLATASPSAASERATQILGQANRALDESSRVHQSGDIASAYRLLRRADAWDARATRELIDAIASDRDRLVSHPALHSPNAASLHLNMVPGNGRGHWRLDRTLPNPFRESRLWETAGWTHDSRREDLALSNIRIADAGTEGQTAMVLKVDSRTGQPLPGGYAGTMMRIRSGTIPMQQGECFRIDARVRVTGDLRRPHRGALIYDTYAGPELGLFVRPSSDWQDVRLYRVATDTRPLRATFEMLGEGELQIESLSIARWRSSTPEALPLRPLVSDAHPGVILEPALR